MTVDESPALDEAPIIIGGREQLFHLLAEAAEIEHTLMCTYLYSAFSLKHGVIDGLSPSEVDAIARWRKVILSVATDEMVHLLLVANLTIAIGGRPHFGRPNFPVAPGYFPSGVVAKLAPFSPQTLDHFIFLERPQGSTLKDGSGFEPELAYRREEAYHGLMPSVQDYKTVGHLYEALRANLTSCAETIGNDSLFIGPVTAQVGRDTVDLNGVMTVFDLESALRSIDIIIEQGEGSPGDRVDSHYQKFVKMREEFATLRAARAEFEPSWPAAENPVMRRPPEPEGKVFIHRLESARLLDFTNALYGLLLRFLVQGFGAQGPNAADMRTAYMTAAIEIMHLLSLAGSALVVLPAGDEAGVNAGMTFTMLRGIEPLVTGAAELRLTVERLKELEIGAQMISSTVENLGGMGRRLAAIATQLNSLLARWDDEARQ